MTPEEKSEAIDRAISSVEGRRKLAAAGANFIRQKMQEPSRNPFTVIPLCPKCGMPEDEYPSEGHSDEECTVYRVMES
jgi:hypothetical protein